MNTLNGVAQADRQRALWLSTVAFTLCFAVWTIFAIIGVQIKAELGLSETQFGLLVATPILTGSLIRLLLGIWTEQYGGRLVFPAQMLLAAAATWMLTWAETYPMYLVAALGVGLAGGSFAIGVAYVSRWFPAGAAGHGARHLRRGQCRRGGDQVRRALRDGRLRLGGGGAGLGYRPGGDGGDLLPLRQRRPDAHAAPGERRSGAEPRRAARAAEEAAGLALLALLFLRVRRLRGAGAVAAALSRQRLRPRHQHRRHGGGGVQPAGQPIPRLWRAPLRPVRRAHV